jgi:hypothetical protein
MAEPGEFLNPVSAMLTRALAEAAAGSPVPVGSTNGELYFVASYTAVPQSDDTNPPGEDPAVTFNGLFNIQPPLPTWSDAVAAAQQMGPGYGAFGPFRSTFITPRAQQLRMMSVAIELQDAAGDPSGRISIPTPGFTPPPGIEPPPPEYDALFFTPEAVAKFALPYYSGIYGNGFGREVLTQFIAAEAAVMGHMPWSEYTDIDPGGPGPDVVRDGPRQGYVREIPVVLHPDGTRQPLHPPAPAAAS